MSSPTETVVARFLVARSLLASLRACWLQTLVSRGGRRTWPKTKAHEAHSQGGNVSALFINPDSLTTQNTTMACGIASITAPKMASIATTRFSRHWNIERACAVSRGFEVIRDRTTNDNPPNEAFFDCFAHARSAIGPH